MAGRNPQTHAKRARELAVKERRERKRAKKAEAAAQRAAGVHVTTGEADEADSPSLHAPDDAAERLTTEGAGELGSE